MGRLQDRELHRFLLDTNVLWALLTVGLGVFALAFHFVAIRYDLYENPPHPDLRIDVYTHSVSSIALVGLFLNLFIWRRRRFLWTIPIGIAVGLGIVWEGFEELSIRFDLFTFYNSFWNAVQDVYIDILGGVVAAYACNEIVWHRDREGRPPPRRRATEGRPPGSKRGTPMDPNVKRYWEQFLASLPAGAKRPSAYVDTAAFGFTWDDAREIASLVRNGTKTATGGLVWSNDADGKPVSKPGDHWIVIAGTDEPVCIIETTEVRVIPYDEVPEAYAWEGGEGDRTLRDWRRIYWEMIVSECKRIGREPSAKAPLAMERFRVIYSEPLRST